MGYTETTMPGWVIPFLGYRRWKLLASASGGWYYLGVFDVNSTMTNER